MPKKSKSEEAGAARSRKAQRRKAASKAKAISLTVIRPDTAEVDIGAMEMFVAVSPDRDAEPVRSFGTFTDDLNQLTGWLKECGVTSVAMESTGVCWIPLYEMLAELGIEVCLVNAKHFKNVPGRKTDASIGRRHLGMPPCSNANPRIASGCSICTRWVYCADRSGPSR